MQVCKAREWCQPWKAYLWSYFLNKFKNFTNSEKMKVFCVSHYVSNKHIFFWRLLPSEILLFVFLFIYFLLFFPFLVSVSLLFYPHPQDINSVCMACPSGFKKIKLSGCGTADFRFHCFYIVTGCLQFQFLGRLYFYLLLHNGLSTICGKREVNINSKQNNKVYKTYPFVTAGEISGRRLTV